MCSKIINAGIKIIHSINVDAELELLCAASVAAVKRTKPNDKYATS